MNGKTGGSKVGEKPAFAIFNSDLLKGFELQSSCIRIIGMNE